MDLAQPKSLLNSNQTHKLLKRQLQRCFGKNYENLPPELVEFTNLVNDAYHSADIEYSMLERTLDLSSAELIDSNNKFQILLEDVERQVQERTKDLEFANTILKAEIEERILAEESLRQSEERSKQQALELTEILRELQDTQVQLIQAEKMSGLGQLVAGVAHEINNPINFISGNIEYAKRYVNSLTHLVKLYQKHYPNADIEILTEIEEIDLDYLLEDLNQVFRSMKSGSERIRQLVLSLRTFSHLDETEVKQVNVHEGIDSTLLLLQNSLKAKPDKEIAIIKNYSKDLPLLLARQV